MEVEEFTAAVKKAKAGHLVVVENSVAVTESPPKDGFWSWICGLLLLSGTLIFLNSNYFSIRQIMIKGNRSVAREAIVLTANLNKGEILWRLDPARLEKALLRHPLIAGVKVTLLYPDRLRIAIRERQPLCWIRQGKRQWIIGNDLAVIRPGFAEEPLQIPEVIGLGRFQLKTGMRLKGTGLDSIRQLVGCSPRQLGGRIRQVDFTRKAVLIETAPNQETILVLLGDFSRIAEQTALLRAILARNPTGKIIGIDLRIPGISTVTTE